MPRPSGKTNSPAGPGRTEQMGESCSKRPSYSFVTGDEEDEEDEEEFEVVSDSRGGGGGGGVEVGTRGVQETGTGTMVFPCVVMACSS